MQIPNLSNLPKEVLHKVINLGGLERKIYCPSCKKYTLHVSGSYADSTTHSNTRKGFYTVFKVVSRLCDYIPFMATVVGNEYACTTCRRIKSEGGILSDKINEKNPGGLS
jgi:hypothetical protein